MNDKEKKAVKDFRHTLDNPDTKFWIGTDGIKNIDIILNLIEKQKAEIEFQKDINNIEKKRHKQTKKTLKGQLEKKDIALKVCEEKLMEERQERIKKDKIIDLMAEHLEKYSTFFPELYGARAKDWKQYFENKVKEKQC